MGSPTVKRCSSCGQEKSENEFYFSDRSAGTRHNECRVCTAARQRDYAQRKRAEMGEEAYLAHQRAVVAASRARRGMTREREWSKARNRAFQRLAELHPEEFERLLDEELGPKLNRRIEPDLNQIAAAIVKAGTHQVAGD